jgi:hypothetical protein
MIDPKEKEEKPLPQGDVSGSTDSEDDAWYEPEECENCVEQMEADGIEYTKDFTWKNGTWVCDHCGMPQ